MEAQMRDFPKTKAVQDALRVATDPDFAARSGAGVRRLAWMVLMQTRGRHARQVRPALFCRPDGEGAA
jgi:hypothetical protein